MDQNTEQHTRAFNKNHAQDGAPYRLRNGREATVLMWTSRNLLYKLAGVYGSEDTPGNWMLDGSFDTRGPSDFDLVMVPLGLIDGKPVFTGDKIVNAYGYEVSVPTSSRDFDCCRWPVLEKKFSELAKQLRDFASRPADYVPGSLLSEAADEIERLDAQLQQVERVLKSYGLRQTGDGEWTALATTDRDMAVAEAVFNKCHEMGERMCFIDLTAIIAAIPH